MGNCTESLLSPNQRQLKLLHQIAEEHQSEIRKAWKATSAVEVQHISAHGFWLFVEATAREYYLPFSEFP